MSAPGEAYKRMGKEMERTSAHRRSASVRAREFEERRMLMIRGEQARLKAEAAARRAAP